MRILLDESVPWRLGDYLTGHVATSVQRRGWASVKNGKLLALAANEFDVLLTADKGMEYQQNLLNLPVAVLVVLSRSNRLDDLVPAVPHDLGRPGDPATENARKGHSLVKGETGRCARCDQVPGTP